MQKCPFKFDAESEIDTYKDYRKVRQVYMRGTRKWGEGGVAVYDGLRGTMQLRGRRTRWWRRRGGGQDGAGEEGEDKMVQVKRRRMDRTSAEDEEPILAEATSDIAHRAQRDGLQGPMPFFP